MRQVNFGEVEAIVLIWKSLSEVTVEAIGTDKLSGVRM